MAIYAGLSPTAALQKWYQLHHTPASQFSSLSGEEQVEAQTKGGMVTLAQENPAAWQFMKTGAPAGKGKLTVFNPMTGGMDEIDKKSLWSHWETYAQLIGGGILGGVALAPVIAGAGGTTAGGTAAAGGVDAATVGAGTGVGVEGAGAGLGAVEGGGFGLADASAITGAVEGPSAAGVATAGLGPSTAANMAATQTALSAGTPTSIAAGGGGGGLGAGWLNSPLGLGLLGSGINAATSIYGINAQTSAAEKAALLNSQSAADQLAFLKEKDAADRAAAAAHDAEAKREWDLTQGLNLAEWNRRQTQLEPYRQKSLAAGQELSRRLGLPAPTGGWNVPNPPVTLADAALYGGGGGAAPGGVQMSPKIAVAPAATDPSLSDPSKWMALVGNDAQLTDFVTKGLGNAAAVPGLVDYYKGKVKGQPGANPTEQAGSAAYWNEKFANDPNRTGGSTTLAAVATPTLTRAPFQPSASSLAAFRPVVIPGAQPTTLADLYQQYAV